MTQRLRGILPALAMLLGCLLAPYLSRLSSGIPLCISGMLFFTFLRLSPRQVVLRPVHLYLFGLQMLLSAVAYALLLPLDELWAEAALLCLMTPVATASPAIVSILRGDVGFITAFVLLSHILITFIVPLVFPYVGRESSLSFWAMAWEVFAIVFPLIILAIASAQLVRWLLPSLATRLNKLHETSFILWLCSLLLLMGHTTEYITSNPEIHWQTIAQMSLVGALACLLQFALGHLLGRFFGLEPHAARQSLGQKNTTLAIWLALLFLNPLTSLSAAAYIVVQNVVISLLMARSEPRRDPLDPASEQR